MTAPAHGDAPAALPLRAYKQTDHNPTESSTT